ncbi:MAG: hypothetical protein HYU36_10880 [Planctomycetes bacterium]|nr:hypothetical protein [Planctomycetota bacterium]
MNAGDLKAALSETARAYSLLEQGLGGLQEALQVLKKKEVEQEHPQAARGELGRLHQAAADLSKKSLEALEAVSLAEQDLSLALARSWLVAASQTSLADQGQPNTAAAAAAMALDNYLELRKKHMQTAADIRREVASMEAELRVFLSP